MQAGGRRFDPVILHHLFVGTRRRGSVLMGVWPEVGVGRTTPSVLWGSRVVDLAGGLALSVNRFDGSIMFFNNLEEAQQ